MSMGKKGPTKGNVVKAPLPVILLAAVDILGKDLIEERLDEEVVLRANVAICPSLIRIKRLGKDAYEVATTSRCDIPDCPYWERCARLDGERQLLFMRAVDELLGRADDLFKTLRWQPREVDEASLFKIIDRLLERLKSATAS